jgi:hypothetical protein
MPSTQQAIDILDDAQAVQKACGEEGSAFASPSLIILKDPSQPADDESSASSSSSSSDIPETEPTEADDDEEFGAFVSASADTFKQPVCTSALPFNLQEEDEALELLNTSSVPEWQTGIFVGSGIIEPVYAGLDTSTRNLRRAGKLALRKLQTMREKKMLDAQERAPHLFKAMQVDVEEPTKAIIYDKVENEYLPATAPVISKHPLDGVMRPVSFAEPSFAKPSFPSPQQLTEIDKMIEDEREVWS